MSLENEYKIAVPRNAKVAYASANTASNILNGIGFAAITFFYNYKMGLSAELGALAWMIFLVWNAINDPLIGYVQDRTKSPLGRRIPYLRFGAPIYGVLFIMLWFPLVDISNQMALFWYFVLMLFAFDTIFTNVGIITYILPAEMTVSSKERASLMVYATFIGVIGYVITFLLPMLLLTGDQSPTIDPAFPVAMILIGIICGIVMFVSSYYIKENKYTQLEEPLRFISSMVETFKNKPFIILQISVFVGLLTSTIITSAIFYYVEFVLILTGDLSILPLLIVIVVAFPFTYVYSRLVPKYGLKKLYIIGFAILSGAFLMLFLTGRSLPTAIPGLILLGIGYSSTLITAPLLFGDTVDYDETRTGRRRESTYSGVEALLTKPAISIANGFFLMIISAFGFDNAASSQSDPAKMGIMIGFTLMPAIFTLIAALVMNFYSLDGPDWNKQKDQLQKIHERKEREYIAHIKNKEKIK